MLLLLPSSSPYLVFFKSYIYSDSFISVSASLDLS